MRKALQIVSSWWNPEKTWKTNKKCSLPLGCKRKDSYLTFVLQKKYMPIVHKNGLFNLFLNFLKMFPHQASICEGFWLLHIWIPELKLWSSGTTGHKPKSLAFSPSSHIQIKSNWDSSLALETLYCSACMKEWVPKNKLIEISYFAYHAQEFCAQSAVSCGCMTAYRKKSLRVVDLPSW